MAETIGAFFGLLIGTIFWPIRSRFAHARGIGNRLVAFAYQYAVFFLGLTLIYDLAAWINGNPTPSDRAYWVALAPCLGSLIGLRIRRIEYPEVRHAKPE